MKNIGGKNKRGKIYSASQFIVQVFYTTAGIMNLFAIWLMEDNYRYIFAPIRVFFNICVVLAIIKTAKMIIEK